jgi:hypothetical protein
MKFVNLLISIFIIQITLFSSLQAQQIGQETSFDRQLNTKDDQPVREFVESKENIDVKEKAQNLEISGDVRFEWRSIQEKGVVLSVPSSYLSSGDLSGVYLVSDPYYNEISYFSEEYRAFRGGDHVLTDGLPISTNDFDVEFNLKFKYNYKKSWAMAHLQFDNPAGIRVGNDCVAKYAIFNEDGSAVIVNTISPRDTSRALKGSGLGLAVNLKRAYMGYNVWADGKHRLDIEIGRRKFDDIFVSEIEFSSRFDGILLKYASALEDMADWYINVGAFLIDERVNHFGWITELGVLNIYDMGLDLRYSFVDWTKRGSNRCFAFNPLGTDFQISQWSWSYHFSPLLWEKEVPFEFYGGFLINHGAKKNRFTKGKLKNLGWYAGLYVGSVDKEGDWSFDIEYIAVQAQAVPDPDVGSIGRGNIFDLNLVDVVGPLQSLPRDFIEDYSYPSSYFYPSSYSSSSPSRVEFLGYFPRQGNANFIGWRFEFLYAITDNLSLDVIYEFSNAEDRRIGGPHNYHDFELEAIYAF